MFNKINIRFIIFNSWVVIILLSGCKKFLDEKSNQNLVVPTSVENLQSLLDDENILNQNEPNIPVIAADNFYVNAANLNTIDEFQRNVYVWSKSNMFQSGAGNAWVVLYSQIYKANIVLDNLKIIKRTQNNQAVWDNVKGQALFIRAKCFLQAAFIWANAYSEKSAQSDLSIPLRLDANFNTPSIRSNVQQTYSQILVDLKLASNLLPDVPLHVIRPSKPASFGLLARTYLAMGKPDSVLKFSNLCLKFNNKLMDYNGDLGIDQNAQFPFSRFNPEVIYDTNMGYPSILYYGYIDPKLYMSYEDGDLRKNLFHKGGHEVDFFKGTYAGNYSLFCGLATDEVYLMRAESNVRLNNIELAIEDINFLLHKRWDKNVQFIPFSSISKRETLSFILKEREKELVFRGLRWMDIKRLNVENENIVMRREINDVEYILEPNDTRYAMPIPEDIILNSGMMQNP